MDTLHSAYFVEKNTGPAGIVREKAERRTEDQILREQILKMYKITYSFPAIARALDHIISSAYLQNFSNGRYDIAPPTKRILRERLQSITEEDLLQNIRRRGRPRKSGA